MKYLKKRALMIRAIRNFFNNSGYLEVETPLRIPAPIPEEHIEPFESEGWYLQSSPEICMKRLAAQGYGKIFQICKCFRKDERGDRHLTELTMLEWYKKDYTYMELMCECEKMIKDVAKELLIKNIQHAEEPKELETEKKNQCPPTHQKQNGLYGLYLDYGNHRIALHQPWQQITVSDAFRLYGSMSMEEAEQKGAFDEIMAFEIEPCLGLEVPTFIYDYPASRAALAKLKSDDKNLAERFELYIAGIELANGFSELTDPVEQKERLIKVLANRKNAKSIISAPAQEQTITKTDRYPSITQKIMPMPEKFIKDLAKMPKTAGIALGIDRLAMLFANASTIDKVVTFTPEEL